MLSLVMLPESLAKVRRLNTNTVHLVNCFMRICGGGGGGGGERIETERERERKKGHNNKRMEAPMIGR